MSTVLVFGTFDGFHPGHQSFLAQAKALGNRLVVIVARDEVVEYYKHRRPLQTLEERLARVGDDPDVDDAQPGDPLEEQGSYAVLRRIAPDIVALGYDQDHLRKNLESQEAFRDRLKTVTLEPFKPDIYKSSLLRRDDPV